MTGVKMGDRLVQIGCAHGGRLARGRGEGRSLRTRRRRRARRERRPRARARAPSTAGVLVEVEIAPPTRLPLDDDAFDLAVVDDTAGCSATMRAEDRVVATVRETAARAAARRPRRWSSAPRRAAASARILSRAQSGPPFTAVGRRQPARSRPTASSRCARSPSAKGWCSSRESSRDDERDRANVWSNCRARRDARVGDVLHRAHVRCRPPSIGIVSPVIQPARSDARNRISAATSSRLARAGRADAFLRALEKRRVLRFVHARSPVQVRDGDARVHRVHADAERRHLERRAARQLIDAALLTQ